MSIIQKYADLNPESQLGIEDGGIPDHQISASSELDNFYASHGRLNEAGDNPAWCPDIVDANQWVQVDLGVQRLVTGVVIQGRGDTNHKVTKFTVQISNDDISYEDVTNNGDTETMVRHVRQCKTQPGSQITAQKTLYSFSILLSDSPLSPL